MGRIGLSRVFFLPTNTEWEGSFIMKQKTLLDKEGIPCKTVNISYHLDIPSIKTVFNYQDPDYSFQASYDVYILYMFLL